MWRIVCRRQFLWETTTSSHRHEVIDLYSSRSAVTLRVSKEVTPGQSFRKTRCESKVHENTHAGDILDKCPIGPLPVVCFYCWSLGGSSSKSGIRLVHDVNKASQ